MSPDTFAFRVDASFQMGSGHVMRCLTLAQALRAQGAVCTFICREHPGHLMSMIRGAGFSVEVLAAPAADAPSRVLPDGLEHSSWLGATQEADAAASNEILLRLKPQWLVVDHYSLDVTWERLVAAHAQHILVIDDLADRTHHCDLLLDQNLGREIADYANRVPSQCAVLVGPGYALLRPEFAALRGHSLKARCQGELRSICVAMGGVDAPDASGKILEALRRWGSKKCIEVSVIMGAAAPALESVKQLALTMPWPTRVLVGISNVAEVLADSDLVIGAVGGSAWERCALGVPSLMVVLAQNQRPGATALAKEGAALMIGEVDEIEVRLPVLLAQVEHNQVLKTMSEHAAKLVDGRGTDALVSRLCMVTENSSSRGTLREMEFADLSMVWEWRNHFEVRRYMYTHHEISWEEHCGWFARTTIDPLRKLLIYDLNGKSVGFVSFTQRTSGGIAEWGFYLAPTAAKGTGRLLGRAALDHAFQVMKLHKVCGQALGFNERSIRFHSGMGFVQEGVLREQHFDGDVHHDIYHFGLLSREWLPVEGKSYD